GKVKSVRFLEELGAEVLGNSMVIADNAYEIMPGFMGTAIGELTEHRSNLVDVPSEALPKSEEALLAQYLLRALE
ncbi:MAG TPA: hypothetical protein VIV60_15880, partial [Polyangiaceae bacterium]